MNNNQGNQFGQQNEFNQQPNNFNNGGFNQQPNNFNNGGFNQQPNNFNNGGFNQQPNNFNNGGKSPNAVKDFFHGTKQSEDFISPQDIQANKNICILSYFGILLLIPLLVRTDSRYARFHCNQGLLLAISSFIISIARVILRCFLCYTSIGCLIYSIISLVLNLTILSFFILGIYNAVKGKAVELPIIGKFRIIKTVPNSNNMNGGMNNGGFNQNNMNNNGFNQNNMNNGGFNQNNMNNNGFNQNNMNNNGFNQNNGFNANNDFANSSSNGNNNNFQ